MEEQWKRFITQEHIQKGYVNYYIRNIIASQWINRPPHVEFITIFLPQATKKTHFTSINGKHGNIEVYSSPPWPPFGYSTDHLLGLYGPAEYGGQEYVIRKLAIFDWRTF
jgi:hypothetical protein